MPLTISPEKYNEIRRNVKEGKISQEAANAEILTEQNSTLPRSFNTADDFLAYLDSIAYVPD